MTMATRARAGAGGGFSGAGLSRRKPAAKPAGRAHPACFGACGLGRARFGVPLRALGPSKRTGRPRVMPAGAKQDGRLGSRWRPWRTAQSTRVGSLLIRFNTAGTGTSRRRGPRGAGRRRLPSDPGRKMRPLWWPVCLRLRELAHTRSCRYRTTPHLQPPSHTPLLTCG